MAKKIRLIDEQTEEVQDGDAVTTQSAPVVAGGLNPEQVEQMMKYAEAIDWKLWEILKLLRSKIESE